LGECRAVHPTEGGCETDHVVQFDICKTHLSVSIKKIYI